MPRGDATAIIRPEFLTKVMEFLKKDSRLLFNVLIDITAVDYSGRDPRFDVVYHLLSLPFNRRLQVKIRVPEDGSRSGFHDAALEWRQLAGARSLGYVWYSLRRTSESETNLDVRGISGSSLAEGLPDSETAAPDRAEELRKACRIKNSLPLQLTARVFRLPKEPPYSRLPKRWASAFPITAIIPACGLLAVAGCAWWKSKRCPSCSRPAPHR